MSEHIKLPLEAEGAAIINEQREIAVASFGAKSEDEDGNQTSHADACATAEFIVTAINCHYEMLAALKTAKQHMEQLASTVNVLSPGKVRAIDFTEKIEAAISEAEA